MDFKHAYINFSPLEIKQQINRKS